VSPTFSRQYEQDLRSFCENSEIGALCEFEKRRIETKHGIEKLMVWSIAHISISSRLVSSSLFLMSSSTFTAHEASPGILIARGCHTCGAPGEGLRCGRCPFVFYCNSICQRKDWPTHKKVCRVGVTAPIGLTANENPLTHYMKTYPEEYNKLKSVAESEGGTDLLYFLTPEGVKVLPFAQGIKLLPPDVDVQSLQTSYATKSPTAIVAVVEYQECGIKRYFKARFRIEKAIIHPSTTN
jgi:hypothetical protein